MRKYLIAFIISCMSLCAMAKEHLLFKGIPITGSMTVFCQKLKAKGFVQVRNDESVHWFKGDFTGRSATVGVVGADNGQEVYSIAVFFDESDSWNTLVNTYQHYKDLYMEKYGKPTQCVENNPSTLDSNVSLMHALSQGRVTYCSIFEAPGGLIQISIENGAYNEGHVMIKYQDEQNALSKRQRDLDEI